MKFSPKAAALCAAVLLPATLAPLAAHAAKVQPDAGYYRALIYIASATGAGCESLGYAANDQTSGIFYYSGPSAAGSVMRFPNGTDTQILAQTFPTTPAAGAATWSGSSKEGYEPGGATISIPFKATINYLDKASFSAVFTATVALSAASPCKITENILFFKTGS
jgi:hypothetical protein